MPPASAPPRPSVLAPPRDETLRREVRRGMITMLDAIVAHVAELEARVVELERRLRAEAREQGGEG